MGGFFPQHRSCSVKVWLLCSFASAAWLPWISGFIQFEFLQLLRVICCRWNFWETFFFFFPSQEGPLWLSHTLQTCAERTRPFPRPIQRTSCFQPHADPAVSCAAQLPAVLYLVSQRRQAAAPPSKAGRSPVLHRGIQRTTYGGLSAGRSRPLHQPRQVRLQRRQTIWLEEKEPHDRCSLSTRSPLKVWQSSSQQPIRLFYMFKQDKLMSF